MFKNARFVFCWYMMSGKVYSLHQKVFHESIKVISLPSVNISILVFRWIFRVSPSDDIFQSLMFKVNVYVSKNKLFWRCLSYYTKNFSTLFFTGPFYLFSLPIWDVVLQQKILLRMTDVSKLLTWWILVVILSSITQNQNINSEKK